MSEPIRSPGSPDPQERPLRRSWWLFAGAYAVLGVIVVLRLVLTPTPLDLALAALIAIVGAAAIGHRNAVHQLELGRRAEAESFARILQGLSRSVSPDAIVDAIVAELGVGTGADHVVVVRRQADVHGLAATLVSSRPGVPVAASVFPFADLDEPDHAPPPGRDPVAIPIVAVGALSELAMAGAAAARGVRAGVTPAPAAGPPVLSERPLSRPTSPPPAVPAGAAAGAVRSTAAAAAGWVRRGLDRLAAASPGTGSSTGPTRTDPVDPASQRAADRIARRARSVYGLRHTLAAPLRADGEVIGAIVLSRRQTGSWPLSARRILDAAADEASAALARATNHREAENRASTDALTGLPNRRYFDEFCGLLARRRRTDDAVGVLVVDIDWFKAVNDRYGHAAGDAVLREVARAIAGAVRDDDIPARFGGEEFAVLLRNPTRAVAIEVAERVRAAVGRIDLRRIGPSGVTVSIGVAVATPPDQPIADLVEAADRALYRAKRAGRDRVAAA